MKERAKTAAKQPTPARRHSFFKRGDASSFFPAASIQPKLEIGPVDDPLERQADRVADRVVAGGEAASGELQRQPIEEEEEMLQTRPEDGLQRQPDEEEEELLQPSREGAIQRQPLEEEEEMLQPRRERSLQRQAAEEEEEELQAKSEPGASRPGLSQRLDAARGGGGRPLASEALGEMSTAFGRDFGQVRVHTDEPAAQMSRDLDAQAFTHGRDIYFSQGRFDPGSREGRHLLAHELTHVVQQTGSEGAPAVQREETAADAGERAGTRDSPTALSSPRAEEE